MREPIWTTMTLLAALAIAFIIALAWISVAVVRKSRLNGAGSGEDS